MLSSPFRFLKLLPERLRRRQRPEMQVERSYQRWIGQEFLDARVLDGPKISVLVPVHDTPAPLLLAAIRSVTAQTYQNWELCVADDASAASHVAGLLAEQMALDARIKTARLPANGGIAAATNAALALASGAFVALLDHDDELAPGALARVAAELTEYPDADIVFSDEDQVVDGVRCRPYFKPGWNPDLMRGQNLVSHLGVYRRSLAERVGGMRAEFDGSQDYDFSLRAIAATADGGIRHIPEILYHWRQHGKSFSAQRLAVCQQAARAALTEFLGVEARVEANPDIPQYTRVVYPLPESLPLVSVMVPDDAAAPIDPEYDAVELLHGSADGARGEVLVFVAGDLRVVRAGWLHELVSNALRPEIGCAGGRLDRPDGRIFNAGLTLNPDTITGTLRPKSDHDDPGYSAQFLLARSVSAVSKACLAVRRSVFVAAGGFDARAGVHADVDLCLRLAERGLRSVWTPHARLAYRVLPRPEKRDTAAARYMRGRWGKTLAADPYANPNLVIRNNTLALADRSAAQARRLLTP